MPNTTPEQVARLREVFEQVQNSADWKLPVDAVLPQVNATADEIREAVVFYTGSVPRLSSTTCLARHPRGLVAYEVPAWRVQAAGYYSAIGA